MHTIKITDALVTPCFLAAEMGEMLHQLLQQECQNHPVLTLDFSDYKYISETFLYHSIGRLCLDNSWDNATFEQKIHIINLEEDDEEELESVLNNVQIHLALQR